MDASTEDRQRCGIAARRGLEVDCPDGGCALLSALGYSSPVTPDGCPVERIAERAGFAGTVVTTLDELRVELERSGMALSSARAVRSRAARHEAALRRWPPAP